MADPISQQQADILSNLFKDQAYQAGLSKILSGNRIEDKEFEQQIAKAFVERSLVGLGERTLADSTDIDMLSRASSLIGLNAKNEPLISDESFNKEMIRELLPRALGETGNYQFVNSDMSYAMLMRAGRDDKSNPSVIDREIDSFLTTERVTRLLAMISQKKLGEDLPDNITKNLMDTYDVKENFVVDHFETDFENNDVPALSDESIKEDVLSLEAAQQKAYLDHKLSVDLQTDALMKINAIMDENPSFVHRTVVDKLKDKIINTATDFTNPHHLIYPSESIFSETISKVDENGRVVDELFSFKQSLITREPKIEFKSKSPSDEAFKLAALHAQKEGIKYPHVGSTYRDPRMAIGFMKNTVDALIEVGYQIEDISVDPHLRKAFEHHIALNHSQKHTLSEAPESLRVDPEDPKVAEETGPKSPYEEREPMPEEVLAAENTKLNGHALKVHQAMSSTEENPLNFKDLNQEDMNEVLALASLLDQSSENWNESVRELGLAPSARPVVEKIKSEFSKLIDKAVPGNSKRGLGTNEAKILFGAKDIVKTVFKDDPRLENIPMFSDKPQEEQILNQEQEQVVDEKVDNSVENSSEVENKDFDASSNDSIDNVDANVVSNEDVNNSMGMDEYHDVGMQNDDSSIDEQDLFMNDDIGQDSPPDWHSEMGNDIDQMPPPPETEDENLPWVENEDLPPPSEEVGLNERPNVETVNNSHSVDDFFEDDPALTTIDLPPESVEEKIDDAPSLGDENVMNDTTEQPPFSEPDSSSIELELWSNISNKGWSDLESNELDSIASMAPSDVSALLSSINDESVDKRQLKNNIRIVNLLLSEFNEEIQDNPSESEIKLLSRVPEHHLGAIQKEAINNFNPQIEEDDIKIDDDTKNDEGTDVDVGFSRPKI